MLRSPLLVDESLPWWEVPPPPPLPLLRSPWCWTGTADRLQVASWEPCSLYMAVAFSVTPPTAPPVSSATPPSFTLLSLFDVQLTLTSLHPPFPPIHFTRQLKQNNKLGKKVEEQVCEGEDPRVELWINDILQGACCLFSWITDCSLTAGGCWLTGKK